MDHKIPPTNHAHSATTILADDSYYSALCRYKFLEFLVIISNDTIIHLSFSREGHHQALKRIRQLIPKAELASSNDEIVRAKKLVQQMLDAGPGKPTPDFNHNPFLKNSTEFQQKIWRMISLIKPGETTTYGELASAAGSPGGARAVGQTCNQNPLALIIPCHRVVAANGPGGFAGDLAIKLKLLEIEKNLRNPPGVQLRDIKCSGINF